MSGARLPWYFIMEDSPTWFRGWLGIPHETNITLGFRTQSLQCLETRVSSREVPVVVVVDDDDNVPF